MCADVEIKKKELPPNTETFDEATGIKTLTQYKLNGKGQRVKVIRIHQIRSHARASLRVEQVTKKIKVESRSKQLRKKVVERRVSTTLEML